MFIKERFSWLSLTQHTIFFAPCAVRHILILSFVTVKEAIYCRLHDQGAVVGKSTGLLGICMEELHFQGSIFSVWEYIDGRQQVRAMVQAELFSETNALIYIIECNDPGQLEQAKDNLHWNLHDDCLQNVPVLLLCNTDNVIYTKTRYSTKYFV